MSNLYELEGLKFYYGLFKLKSPNSLHFLILFALYFILYDRNFNQFSFQYSSIAWEHFTTYICNLMLYPQYAW